MAERMGMWWLDLEELTAVPSGHWPQVRSGHPHCGTLHRRRILQIRGRQGEAAPRSERNPHPLPPINTSTSPPN
uniref:Uncharacterized protein n=1 Tax=Arundo donax TaxID=35708 RepID=A0A0A8YAP0_ARUDO